MLLVELRAKYLQFFVDGNGPFNVMTSRGDIHDTYETREEAQRVADELTKRFGRRPLRGEENEEWDDHDYDPPTNMCPDCEGHGKMNGETCERCNGHGEVFE